MEKSYLNSLKKLNQSYKLVKTIEHHKRERSELHTTINHIIEFFSCCFQLKKSVLEKEIVAKDIISNFLKIYNWYFKLSELFSTIDIIIRKHGGVSRIKPNYGKDMLEQMNDCGGMFTITLNIPDPYYLNKFKDNINFYNIHVVEFNWDEKNTQYLYSYKFVVGGELLDIFEVINLFVKKIDKFFRENSLIPSNFSFEN